MKMDKRRIFFNHDDIHDVLFSDRRSNRVLKDLTDLFQDMEDRGAGREGADTYGDEIPEEEGAGGHEQTDDYIEIYLKAIRDIPALNRDEEIVLARRFKEGRALVKAVIVGIPFYKKIEEAFTGNKDRGAEEGQEEERSDKAVTMTLKILNGVMKKIGSGGWKLDKRIGLEALRELTAEERIEGLNSKELDILEDVIQKEHERGKEEVRIEMDTVKDIWDAIRRGRMLALEARNELIRHSLKLVVYMAEKYKGRGLPLSDLIQEGNLGLMKAVDRFRHEKGFRLGTYAPWWVWQAITKAVTERTRLIKVPAYMLELYSRVADVSKELAQRLEREPDNEEIAETLGSPAGKVEEAIRAAGEPEILEHVEWDDEDVEDFIVDTRIPSPHSEAVKSEMSVEIPEILKALSPKEKQVMRMRYGIGLERDFTLGEIGRRLSLTHQRVQQIEAAALKKLRRSDRIKALYG